MKNKFKDYWRIYKSNNILLILLVLLLIFLVVNIVNCILLKRWFQMFLVVSIVAIAIYSNLLTVKNILAREKVLKDLMNRLDKMSYDERVTYLHRLKEENK